MNGREETQIENRKGNKKCILVLVAGSLTRSLPSRGSRSRWYALQYNHLDKIKNQTSTYDLAYINHYLYRC